MSIGYNLRKLRTEARMSVPELSQAARIDAYDIRAYEFGDLPISAEHEERLLTVLTVDRNTYIGKTFRDVVKPTSKRFRRF